MYRKSYYMKYLVSLIFCLSQWSASDASGPNPHTPHCFGTIIFQK